MNGAAVLVYPTAEQAAAIVQPGGESVEALHVTLAYFGDVAELGDEFRSLLVKALDGLAETSVAMEGSIAGHGHFAEGEDGVPCLALVDVPGLAELHSALLAEVGFDPAEGTHGYTPHLTLAYHGPGECGADEAAIEGPLSFSEMVLHWADDEPERFPLGGGDEMATKSTTAAARKDHVHDVTPSHGNGTVAARPRKAHPAAIVREPSSVTAAAPDLIVDLTEEDGVTGAWTATLIVEDLWTGDNRRVEPGALTWRDLPFTLGGIRSDVGGHDNAEPAGQIAEIERVGNEIVGSGLWDSGEPGQEFRRMAMEGTMLGISVDLDDVTSIIGPDPRCEGDPEECPMAEQVTKGRIASAAIVRIPAQQEARITMVASADVPGRYTFTLPFGVDMTQSLTAAFVDVPMEPPRSWFSKPDPSEFQETAMVTIQPNGRVFCRLGEWDKPHRSFAGEYVFIPRSPTGYGEFLQGSTRCDDGSVVRTGCIVVGGGHADTKSLGLDPRDARKSYYDDANGIWAEVTVGEDEVGPWLAGAVLAGCDEFTVRRAAAAKVSGDWRDFGKGLDLIAVLSVPTNGFGANYPQARVASGAVVALVASFAAKPPTSERSTSERLAAIEDRLDRRDLADMDAQMGLLAQ